MNDGPHKDRSTNASLRVCVCVCESFVPPLRWPRAWCCSDVSCSSSRPQQQQVAFHSVRSSLPGGVNGSLTVIMDRTVFLLPPDRHGQTLCENISTSSSFSAEFFQFGFYLQEKLEVWSNVPALFWFSSNLCGNVTVAHLITNIFNNFHNLYLMDTATVHCWNTFF